MLMQNFYYQTLYFLNFFIPALILLGGGVFHISGAKVEIGQMDPWFLLLLLLNFLCAKIFKQPSPLQKVINKLIRYDFKKKHYFFLLFGAFSYLFIVHVAKYLSFNVHGRDQGYLHQSLLNAFETPLFKCDVCNFGTYFGEHVSPALMLVAPIYIFLKSDVLIYLIEVLLVAIPIHFLIKTFNPKKLNGWFILLFIALCHRGLRYSLIWDFREDHLTFFFLSFALIAVKSKKLVWALVLFILTLFTKEHLVYFLPFLCFPIWFEREFGLSKKQKIMSSLVVVLFSIAWMLMIKNVIIPYYNGGIAPTNHIVKRFPGYGATDSEVVKNILFVPKYWVKLLSERILALDTWKYLYMLLAPFILLIYRRWWWLAAGAPIIAMNVLSYAHTQRSLSFHYELSIYPLLIVALILGYKEVSKKRLYFALILALLSSGRWPGFYLWQNLPTGENLADQRFFSNIENDALYASSFKNTAYLAHLEEFKVFNCSTEPFDFERKTQSITPAFNLQPAQAIIIDKQEKCQLELLRRLESQNWQISKSSASGDYVILQKPE